jgi:hypothetical protein
MTSQPHSLALVPKVPAQGVRSDSVNATSMCTTKPIDRSDTAQGSGPVENRLRDLTRVTTGRKGGTGPGLTARLCSLFLLTWFALDPPCARAGSITYTWVEDDKQKVDGSLKVSDSVLTAGKIALTAVETFSFSVPGGSWSLKNIDPNILNDFPMPISATTAAPTGKPDVRFSDVATNSPRGGLLLQVAFDTNWNVNKGEAWYDFNDAPNYTGVISKGVGHWTIATPEPSTFVMAFIATVAGLAYGWRRRCHAQLVAADRPREHGSSRNKFQASSAG